MSEAVEKSLVTVCENISNRLAIHFLKIGADENHVRILIQSVPMMFERQITQTLKSITVKELFRLHPEVNHQFWSGQFWSDGYYINIAGKYGNEEVIQKYIHEQGGNINTYKKFHSNQSCLF